MCFVFFFKQKTAYEMRISDWSSDVCSSDLPGGPEVGAAILAHPLIRCVAFTGSTATAKRINRQLAGGDGPIIPLIAETGGQNAMIVDSSALPEQVVNDLIVSAFQSAGPRWSAARSEEHTSELQSLTRTPDAGFCLQK